MRCQVVRVTSLPTLSAMTGRAVWIMQLSQFSLRFSLILQYCVNVQCYSHLISFLAVENENAFILFFFLTEILLQTWNLNNSSVVLYSIYSPSWNLTSPYLSMASHGLSLGPLRGWSSYHGILDTRNKIAALCRRCFFFYDNSALPSAFLNHPLAFFVQMNEICNKCADVLGSKHSRHKWLPIQLWPTSSAVRTEWGLAAQMYLHISWKAERYILALSS